MAESKLRSKFTERVTCIICFDQFNNGDRVPKLLPCQHTTCLRCIESIHQTEKAQGKQSTVSCPVCRRSVPVSAGGVRGLPNNLVIQDLLNLLEDTSWELPTSESKAVTDKPDPQIICQKHRGHDITQICLDCRELLCMVCQKKSTHELHNVLDATRIFDHIQTQLTLGIKGLTDHSMKAIEHFQIQDRELSVAKDQLEKELESQINNIVLCLQRWVFQTQTEIECEMQPRIAGNAASLLIAGEMIHQFNKKGKEILLKLQQKDEAACLEAMALLKHMDDRKSQLDTKQASSDIPKFTLKKIPCPAEMQFLKLVTEDSKTNSSHGGNVPKRSTISSGSMHSTGFAPPSASPASPGSKLGDLRRELFSNYPERQEPGSTTESGDRLSQLREELMSLDMETDSTPVVQSQNESENLSPSINMFEGRQHADQRLMPTGSPSASQASAGSKLSDLRRELFGNDLERQESGSTIESGDRLSQIRRELMSLDIETDSTTLGQSQNVDEVALNMRQCGQLPLQDNILVHVGHNNHILILDKFRQTMATYHFDPDKKTNEEIAFKSCPVDVLSTTWKVLDTGDVMYHNKCSVAVLSQDLNEKSSRFFENEQLKAACEDIVVFQRRKILSSVKLHVTDSDFVPIGDIMTKMKSLYSVVELDTHMKLIVVCGLSSKIISAYDLSGEPLFKKSLAYYPKSIAVNCSSCIFILDSNQKAIHVIDGHGNELRDIVLEDLQLSAHVDILEIWCAHSQILHVRYVSKEGHLLTSFKM